MDLSGKKLAVYGLGVTGNSTLDYLKTQSLSDLIVLSRGLPKDWGINKKDFPYPVFLFSEDDPKVKNQLKDRDLILLSPGIPRTTEALNEVLATIPVWNEIELAYRSFDGPIMALTGTNGKTTTVSFIGDFLKRLGLNVFVGGNIGVPFVDALKSNNYDCAVLEMSSFQCESLDNFRASVSGILNLFPNHGERYSSVDDYRTSKWQLVKNAEHGDHLFIGMGVGEPPFSYEGSLIDLTSITGQELEDYFDISSMLLVGSHNRINVYFAYLMLKRFLEQFPETKKNFKRAFQDAINEFPGVEHRVECLGNYGKLEVFNDAKSTNWDATMTALKAVSEREQPIHLIIGGQLRGNNDDPPKDFLNWTHENKVEIYSIGEAGAFLEGTGNEEINFCSDLETALNQVKEKEGVLVFSPAFPSFDQFKNYVERGTVFKTLVSQILP
ncbi:MAG: UDP-N-acetylmuramoyl-L-alanine--D-glutamate ligase [Halobacteriovoraceae bacterium]|nr:UDP-N-acetylmuramoyl-L-alanine--D-glutamate ligase [Halobacteriovoraceae bacterium]